MRVRDPITSSLAVAAAVCLAACGGGDPTGGGPGPGTADTGGGADTSGNPGGAAAAQEERNEMGAPAPAPDAGYGEAADVFTNYDPPEDAVWVEARRDDGSVAARGWVLEPDGSRIRVGPHRTRHPNGTPESEGSYDGDGMRQGYWHFWHDNGRIAEEGFYVDGELDRSRFWVRRDRDGTWLGGSNPPPSTEVSL